MAEGATREVGDWDLTPYFEEFDGPQYRAFRADLASDSAEVLSETLELGEMNSEIREDSHRTVHRFCGSVSCNQCDDHHFMGRKHVQHFFAVMERL